MKKILIIICILCLSCGCSNKNNNPVHDKNDMLKEIMAENNYIIVDVRTKEEYDTEHVVEAINIPYDTIDEKVDLDKSKTIVVYCQSGKRSSVAYNTLKDLGYDVFDLGAYSTINLDKESNHANL